MLMGTQHLECAEDNVQISFHIDYSEIQTSVYSQYFTKNVRIPLKLFSTSKLSYSIKFYMFKLIKLLLNISTQYQVQILAWIKNIRELTINTLWDDCATVYMNLHSFTHSESIVSTKANVNPNSNLSMAHCSSIQPSFSSLETRIWEWHLQGRKEKSLMCNNTVMKIMLAD